MAVPTLITDLSVTLASNSPSGTDVIGTTADDFIRAHSGFIAQLYAGKKAYASVSTTYTLLATDGLVECDATAGAFAVTLTAAASSLGRLVTIKKIDASANAITVTASGAETIDGANTYALSTRYDAVTLHCDGVTWNVINKVAPAASSTQNWTTKTTTYTAVNGDRIAADTSGGAFTITLPATPTAGHYVEFTDGGGAWATNNLTIARNGSTIMGLSEDMICGINNMGFGLVYNGTTWRLF